MKENEKTKDKYEFNIAEFPIFNLSKKRVKDLKFIEYKDTIIGKNKEVIPRKWTVFPHADLGFPSASALATFYDLFQIWREQGFKNQHIYFGSIYHLLKRRKTTTGKRDYDRIKSDLERLVGITVKAENAFWDNDIKAYVDMTFHMFDKLELYKEKADGQAFLPFARIKASDELFGSVLKNSLFLTRFDSDFFHQLKPVEQRLALYLSKIFRSQKINKRELFEFAKQIPIQVKQKKLIKQRLKIACEGLLEKEYKLLEAYWFEKGKDRKEYIVFKRKGSPKLIPKESQTEINVPPKEQYEIDILVEDILQVCQDEASTNYYKKIARLLPRDTIYRALAEVREVMNLGEIKKSKGALFTSLIKEYARQEGTKL